MRRGRHRVVRPGPTPQHRLPDPSLFAWLLLAFGTGSRTVAGLQLTGRLGPAQLWFRAPSFYVAAAILVLIAAWWFRRTFVHPAARLIRFGLPAMALVLLAMLAVVQRLDGRSTPLSALMPTMRAVAPELSFHDSGGAMRQLSEYRGKVVLVNFWATWCGPCRHEMPMLSSAQAEFGGHGLVVVYLSLEEPAVLEKFLRTNHFERRAGPPRAGGRLLPRGQDLPVELPHQPRRPRREALERPARRRMAARVDSRRTLIRSAVLENDVPVREQ